MCPWQGLFIVTLSDSEESSPDVPREILRFAQHDWFSVEDDYEKALVPLGTRKDGNKACGLQLTLLFPWHTIWVENRNSFRSRRIKVASRE